MQAKRLIAQIQAVLSDTLLSPSERKAREPGCHSLTGHCYVATEALFYGLGSDFGFRPMVANLGTMIIEGTHWWLQNKAGQILDPTAEQFHPSLRPYIYAAGRPCGFLTKQPSRRAQEVLRRIKQKV